MVLKPTFAQLFKFFRIKSGFKTLSQFADQLAEEGFIYDESLFSHWQRGSRVPSNRKLIITIIKVFLKKRAITYVGQANIFLQSAKKTDLTLEEKERLSELKFELYPILWEIELNNFINLNKDLKQKKQTYNKTYRFNFILPMDTYLYFEKISKKNKVSKATFLRNLIEKHKQLQ